MSTGKGESPTLPPSAYARGVRLIFSDLQVSLTYGFSIMMTTVVGCRIVLNLREAFYAPHSDTALWGVSFWDHVDSTKETVSVSRPKSHQIRRRDVVSIELLPMGRPR